MRRRGLSLLEVLLALAIFAGSFAVIAQLSSTALRASIQAEDQTHATLRCQSKLAEIMAGITPPEPVSDRSFDDDPRWRWSLEVEPTSIRDLQRVRVTVTRSGHWVTQSLTQLIRDRRVLRQRETASGERP